jgi:hypothetical protein
MDHGSAMEIGRRETVRVFVVGHVDSSDFERKAGIEFAASASDCAVAALVDVTRDPGVGLQFFDKIDPIAAIRGADKITLEQAR